MKEWSIVKCANLILHKLMALYVHFLLSAIQNSFVLYVEVSGYNKWGQKQVYWSDKYVHVHIVNVALQRCVQEYGRTTHSQLHLKLQVNGLLYIVASHSSGAIEFQCAESDLMPQASKQNLKGGGVYTWQSYVAYAHTDMGDS